MSCAFLATGVHHLHLQQRVGVLFIDVELAVRVSAGTGSSWQQMHDRDTGKLRSKHRDMSQGHVFAKAAVILSLLASGNGQQMPVVRLAFT